MANKSRPVFVMTPIGVRTGGPEALHQLVDSVRRAGVESHVLPYAGTAASPVVEDFDNYDYDIAFELPTVGRYSLVLPETVMREPLGSLRKVLRNPEVDLWIWWLSVDNSHHPKALSFSAESVLKASNGAGMYSHNVVGHPHLLEVARRNWHHVRTASRLYQLQRRGVRFMAQSRYAAEFCMQAFDQPACLVSDYLGSLPSVSLPERDPRSVSYNGVKGAELINELHQQLDGVSLIPIEGMTQDEVARALARASAYVEIGSLPGRDRLPREAARLGTPVVVLERGAGRYHDDFPLPASMRVPFDEFWARNLATAIGAILADRGTALADQDGYRQWVETDRSRFDAEVAAWLEIREEAGLNSRG